MPPKEDPTKNRTGGAKQSGNGQEPTDESGRSTRSTVKAAEAQRTTANASDGTVQLDFGGKPVEPSDGSRSTLPSNEATASASAGGDLHDFEMEDASVKEKKDADRIAELKSQLRNEQGANMKMRRTIAEYEEQLAAGSAGAAKSLVERAREIGFVRDVTGKLFLGPPPGQGFDFSKPYSYANRCGQ